MLLIFWRREDSHKRQDELHIDSDKTDQGSVSNGNPTLDHPTVNA